MQAIADAHHASLTACPQPEGGLLIEVTFPEPDSEDPIPYLPETSGQR